MREYIPSKRFFHSTGLPEEIARFHCELDVSIIPKSICSGTSRLASAVTTMTIEPVEDDPSRQEEAVCEFDEMQMRQSKSSEERNRNAQDKESVGMKLPRTRSSS